MSEKKCLVCDGTGKLPDLGHNFLREQYLTFEMHGYARALADAKKAVNELRKIEPDNYLFNEVLATIEALEVKP